MRFKYYKSGYEKYNQEKLTVEVIKALYITKDKILRAKSIVKKAHDLMTQDGCRVPEIGKITVHYRSSRILVRIHVKGGVADIGLSAALLGYNVPEKQLILLVVEMLLGGYDRKTKRYKRFSMNKDAYRQSVLDSRTKKMVGLEIRYACWAIQSIQKKRKKERLEFDKKNR